MTGDDEKFLTEIKKSVNVSASQIEKWLETAESEKVGCRENDKGESVGHHSGRKIFEILHKKQADYTAEDFKHVHKVAGYIRNPAAA